jgi:hypothetical protein
MNGKDGVLVLSSSFTVFARLLFILDSLTAALALVVGWRSGDSALLLVAAGLTLGAVLRFYWYFDLKEIWIEGDAVHASTFRRTITFPVAAIADIEARRLRSARMHLRQPTPFGVRLSFMPRGSRVRGRYPILDEALARARTAPADQLVPLKIVSPWGGSAG